MAEVWWHISHIPDNRHVTTGITRSQGRQTGMQCCVGGQHVALRRVQRQVAPEVEVLVVRDGHHGVQPVIATTHIDHQHHAIAAVATTACRCQRPSQRPQLAHHQFSTGHSSCQLKELTAVEVTAAA